MKMIFSGLKEGWISALVAHEELTDTDSDTDNEEQEKDVDEEIHSEAMRLLLIQ